MSFTTGKTCGMRSNIKPFVARNNWSPFRVLIGNINHLQKILFQMWIKTSKHKQCARFLILINVSPSVTSQRSVTENAVINNWLFIASWLSVAFAKTLLSGEKVGIGFLGNVIRQRCRKYEVVQNKELPRLGK